MEQELQTGLDNLAMADFTVDYVITHCCATDLQTAIVHYLNKPSKADVLTDYFQALEGKLHYKHWYFGHYHYCYPFNISTSDTPTGTHRVFIPLNTQGKKTIRMSQFPLVGGN